MTQWLIEEAAFLMLAYSDNGPERSADPEEAAWQQHHEFLERSMGKA